MATLMEYPTRETCLQALKIIRRYFRLFEASIPPAQWVPWRGAHNWRFTEQSPEQLLLQKLARQISGVQTIDLLLAAGYLQEVGVLYRMLDEIAEDILFVVLGITTGDWTDHHKNYVQYFWSEDENDRQPPVRRKSIRSYIHRIPGLSDPQRSDAVGREIYKTYSDFAHVRSAPIMGMVHGPPPTFELDGIRSEKARLSYAEQHPTYFYRCLISTSAIANVVLAEPLQRDVFKELKAFEHKHGRLLFGPHGGFES